MEAATTEAMPPSTAIKTAIAAVSITTTAAADGAPDHSPDDGLPRWCLIIRSRIGIGDDRTGMTVRGYKIIIL